MTRIAAAVFLLAFAPLAARATQQGVVVIKKWQNMDRCAERAHAAYPDYTAASNAKREALLNDCLAGQNLPPRAPSPPPRPAGVQ